MLQPFHKRISMWPQCDFKNAPWVPLTWSDSRLSRTGTVLDLFPHSGKKYIYIYIYILIVCCSSSPYQFLSSTFYPSHFFQIPQFRKTRKMAFSHECQVNQIFSYSLFFWKVGPLSDVCWMELRISSWRTAVVDASLFWIVRCRNKSIWHASRTRQVWDHVRVRHLHGGVCLLAEIPTKSKRLGWTYQTWSRIGRW